MKISETSRRGQEEPQTGGTLVPAVRKTSEISEFYKKSLDERLQALKEFAELGDEEIEKLRKFGTLEFETANRMIENVVSTFQLPLGIATNFIVNGKEHLIPFAIEEPSVVAAASNAAKLCRASGGFKAESDLPIMIGQMLIVNAKEPEKAAEEIMRNKRELIGKASACDAMLVKFGGGARDIEVRVVNSIRGKLIIVHLLVDVRDAMGANAVNTMCEALAPELEKIAGAGAKARMRIISNLAIYRKARAKAIWKKEELEKSVKGNMKGEEVVDAMLDAYAFADADPFRCTTHNKGIMNGIDAVAIACGQDFRALEAGAHSFAAISGTYKPLTRYNKNENGDLVGEIELPMAVGLVGGAVKTHPIAQIAVKILGVKSASELACVLASAGLAQNFAAMRALTTEGIQRGHMKLHAKNIAVLAGAKGNEIDIVAQKIAEEHCVKADRAKEILEEIRKRSGE